MNGLRHPRSALLAAALCALTYYAALLPAPALASDLGRPAIESMSAGAGSEITVGAQINPQYSVLAGLASDDVARLELFSLRGGRTDVPLRDNTWLVRVAGGDYPLRIRMLGAVALFASMANIVSGFLITDRMLKMFKTDTKPGGNGTPS